MTLAGSARTAGTKLPDIVYPVRPGESNEELRYSLRSLRNLPHGRVWVAGYRPSWCSDAVGFVPTGQQPATTMLEKYQNSRANLRGLAFCPDIAPKVVIMNDDFFITAPLEEVPVLHYGTLGDFFAFFRRHQRSTSTYMLGEQRTHEWLRGQGFTNTLSYALHVPLPTSRTAMKMTLRRLPMVSPGGRVPLHFRTALGNLAQLGGERAPDVKLLRGQLALPGLPSPFASSSDRTWEMGLGNRIREMFPEPGPYER